MIRICVSVIVFVLCALICEGHTTDIPIGGFVKKGTKGEKYAWKGANGSASLDFVKGKFKVGCRGIDLSTCANPIHIEIQFTDAAATDDLVCKIDLTCVEKMDKKSGQPKQFSFTNKAGQAGTIGWAP